MISGFGDAIAGLQQRFGAGAVCAALAFFAATALYFGVRPGPVVTSIVPIAGAIWSCADLLTSFLLLAQFFFNGRASLAILAVAYLINGLLAWPYVLTFPGVLADKAVTHGDQSVFVYYWMIWHVSFPILVLIAFLNDSPMRRLISRAAIAKTTVLIAALTPPLVFSVASVIYARRESLPRLAVNGILQPIDRIVFHPSILVLNAAVCLMLVVHKRQATGMQLWLCVTLFASCLDSLLVNLGAKTYSFAWDAAKVIAVVSAASVLAMIFCDLVTLHARLERSARFDGLTLIPNRKTYQEHLELVFHNAKRQNHPVGIVLFDLDHFKHYNDTFGHAAGDECLRAVAAALAHRTRRPLDLVARYGGEEFIAILPDTELGGVLAVAESMRASVEDLVLQPIERKREPVTVSAGVGFAAAGSGATPAEIFAAADRALYEAKESGRNRVVLDGVGAASRPETKEIRSSSVISIG